MDRRVDVYRPAHNDHRSRSRNRPNLPSRRNSRFDVGPKDGRSPDHVSMESSHSPATTHEETNDFVHDQSNIAKDPRKQRDIVGEPSRTTPNSTSDSRNSLQDIIRDLVKQFLIEEKVTEAERHLKVTEQRRQDLPESLPNIVALKNILREDRKQARSTLDDCSRGATDARDRVEQTFVNLMPVLKELLRNVTTAPSTNSDPVKASKELDDLKTSVKSLSEKLETLTKQNEEQEAELMKIKEQNSKSDLGSFEREIESKISRRFDQTQSQQEKQTTKQKDEIDDLRVKQMALADTVASLRKHADQMDTHVARDPILGAPRSPSSNGHEKEIDAIKEQQKEQKRQLANLSNTFVSCKDYEILCSQSDIVQVKVHESVNRQDRMAEKLVELDRRLKQVHAELDNVKLDMRVSATHPNLTQDQFQDLLTCQDKLQQELQRLEECLTREVAARKASEESPSDKAAAAYNLEEFSRLQTHVKNLQNFSGHYNKFYENTETSLKEMKKQYTELKDAMTEGQNSVRFRLDSFNETFQDNQKSINDCIEQHTKLSGENATFQASMKDQILLLKTSCTPNLQSVVAPIKADIEALRITYKQVNHSIQSLDARFNAISTQKLYHAIVATIQPLLPDMYDTIGKVNALQHTMISFEQTVSQFNEKLQLLAKSKADPVGEHSNVTKENIGALLQEALDDVVQKSDRDTHVGKLLDEHKRHISMLEENCRNINVLQATMRENEKILDGYRANDTVVAELQSQVESVQTDLATRQKRLDEVESGLLQTSEALRRLDGSEHKTEDPHTKVTPTAVERIKSEIDKLRATIFPVHDRYLIFDRIASNVTGDLIRQRLVAYKIEVKDICLRGGKIPGSKGTNRYALIWIATSPDLDVKIDSFLANEEKSASRWSGRSISIVKTNRQLFMKLWTEEPDSVRDHVEAAERNANAAVSSVIAKQREVSTTHSVESDHVDTIVARSSVLPKKVIPAFDLTELTELPDSENEIERQNELDKFGASRNGQKSSRAPLTKGVSSGSATPSSKGAKRNAPDLGSSRASSKRARRE